MASTRFAAAAIALLLMAVSASAQSSSSKPHAKARENSAPEAGAITDGVYRNASLNFSYKVPFGWVDRTSDMREGSELGKSQLLLSIFERPPEAPAEGLNSAVVIAVENVSSYPGLKTAQQYFGPITELATSRGFKAVSDPFEFTVNGKPLVRGDFVKESGPSSATHQTSLVFLQKDWIVSITLIAGSEDERDELVANLNFGFPRGSRRPVK